MKVAFWCSLLLHSFLGMMLFCKSKPLMISHPFDVEFTPSHVQVSKSLPLSSSSLTQKPSKKSPIKTSKEGDKDNKKNNKRAVHQIERSTSNQADNITDASDLTSCSNDLTPWFEPDPSNPKPHYPEEAKKIDLEEVKLLCELVIDPYGKVTHVNVLNANSIHPLFIKEVLKTLSLWKFRLKKVQKSFSIKVPIIFQLES